MKKHLLFVPVLLAGLLASCESPNPPSKDIKVESVSLNQTEYSMKIDDTFQLNATVSPSDATNKDVTWSTSDRNIATVNGGLVTGISEGDAVITVKTVDGEKTATCTFTIKAKDVVHVESLRLTQSAIQLDEKETYTLGVTVLPENAADKSVVWKSSNEDVAIVNNGVISALKEGKTTITVTSNDGGKQAKCEVTVNKAIEPTKFASIAEVRKYIAENPISVNSHNCGVDETKSFTIAGYAIAKFDLIKTKKSFGLDVSYPGKTIIADETGYIACASLTSKGSNSLYEKVANYQCKDTSRYSVTGYVSLYLGQPELVVTSYEWDQNLDVTCDVEKLASKEVTIDQFFEEAKNVYYNCAGHGYGEIFSLKGLTCYSVEADGQGVRYYHFTDGTHNLRVNAFNISQCSVGFAYDIIGITSLKNYSAIIVGLKIKSSLEDPVTLDYENVAIEMPIDNLRKNKTSQDDTDAKYPAYIESYKNIYKVTGYLTSCIQDGKYYLGIRDTYYSSKQEISGKDQARTTYKMALIKNDNFWNCNWEEYELFNPYGEYINVDEPVTFYYIQQQMNYKSGETMWDIFLIPSSLPVIE